MTIYYLDPESGDDTKDGLSFATRWRTFKPLQNITPARGDEFRFRASQAPYSLGNSTWVDNQEFITIADTSSYAIVDMCESGWQVTAPNVVNTLDGVARDRQPMIEKCQQFGIIPANFTGKLAWKTLPAVLDLSAFTNISMILGNQQQWPFAMKLMLCSDTNGDVPVAELPIERFRSHKYPALLTPTNGLALPANVRSVTLWVTEADTRTFNYVTIDNIIACKAPGAANHISHGVILSRRSAEEPEYLPIRGFKAGGQVYLGPVRLYPEGLEWKKWRGPSGQTELFARQPIKLRYLKNKESSFPDSTPGMEVIVTGGWNRADMTVRDSVTWLHGEQSRMMGGGAGSSNPDLPSAADTMQLLFSYGISAVNANVLRQVTCLGFGFAEFTQFPVASDNLYTCNYRFAGLVSVGTGMGAHGPYSYLDMGDVTYCRYGAFTDPQNQTGWSGTDSLPFSVGPGTYKARKIAATNLQNWFPTTNIGVQRIYQIGKIENTYIAFNNSSVFQGMGAGFSKLVGTKIRWCDFDANANYHMLLESCEFLTDAGLPTREPRINFGPRWGLQVRLTSVNNKSWDTRCLYNNGQYAQVKEGIGRSPDKRTMELSVTRPGYDDSFVPVFVRERVALVVARAGIPCTVSGYVKQNWKIDGESYLGPQYACLCTVEGETKGVGRVEGTNLQRPNKWGRVVITFTSAVDALVPIYLETNRQTAWATEVGLDDSGVPPDPVIPIPPPALTDSFKFVAFYENILGALDSYEAGTPEAVQVMQAAIGVPFPGMTSGTIIDKTPGNIIGAALIVSAGTLQVYGALSPGWSNGTGWLNCFVQVKNAAGDIIAKGDAQVGTPQPVASMPGYALYALIAGAATEMPVNGGTYTVEIWRGEAP